MIHSKNQSMQIYFFAAGIESNELQELEGRLRARFPPLQTLTKLDEVTKRIKEHPATSIAETAFIIFPVLTATPSFDRFVNIAEQVRHGIFFIFVSGEISTGDYKRLVRTGGADWVSPTDAPREIADIISRVSRAQTAPVTQVAAKPKIVAFVPSSGGVGNTTLALETAVQLKLDKETRDRRICLLDLDLQTSHVSDYLDIEPRLQMRDIVASPERLDAQLFDLFIGHHSSGVDVLACPRNRQNSVELTMAALDVVFGMIATRYDVLIVDLPSQWFVWTDQVLSVCDLVVVTGFNSVPGLRQVVDCLTAVRSIQPVPPKIVVGLNRCERQLLGGIARNQHVSAMLGSETVVTVRDDAQAAINAVNTGIPIAIASPSSKMSKDIGAFKSLLKGLVLS